MTAGMRGHNYGAVCNDVFKTSNAGSCPLHRTPLQGAGQAPGFRSMPIKPTPRTRGRTNTEAASTPSFCPRITMLWGVPGRYAVHLVQRD